MPAVVDNSPKPDCLSTDHIPGRIPYLMLNLSLRTQQIDVVAGVVQRQLTARDYYPPIFTRIDLAAEIEAVPGAVFQLPPLEGGHHPAPVAQSNAFKTAVGPHGVGQKTGDDQVGGGGVITSLDTVTDLNRALHHHLGTVPVGA